MSMQHSSTLCSAGLDPDSAYRLLILEDSDEIAEILQEIGRAAGYGVLRLSGKTGAVEACVDYRPTVMLLNLGHAASVFAPPRHAEGGELLRGLAATGSAAQIIIISGNPSAIRQSILEEGLSLGLNMVAHMGKPFDIDRLEEHLAELRHR